MFYLTKAAFLLLLGAITPTNCSQVIYGDGDGITITYYEGLDCEKATSTFTSSFITTNMLDDDIACMTDTDEDGDEIFYKISFDCTKDALIKTYSMGCSDDTCSDCTKDGTTGTTGTTQGTESWADWAMYPPSDHCYSQTMSNGNEQSWMISSKGYDDYKLYIDTIVDNSCIEGTGEATATATATSTVTATCGKCLPIMEGDNAYINARLWKTNETEAEYFGYSADDIAPLLQQLPGFIKYAATTTQDPSVFLFYDVFDSEENSKAARKKAMEVNAKLELEEELIHEYMGEIYWSGAPDNCIKGNQVGDYLSSRLFSPDLDRCKDASCTTDYSYEVWKDMKSFDSLISSYADDDTKSFYMNTFNNEEDAHEANDLALSTTNLDPTTKLIATTIGQVAFDFTCSGNNFEYATCMTIDALIHSRPDLIHLCDLVDSCEDGKSALGMSTGEKWTFFAPNDDAFDELGDTLVGVSDATALKLLLFHAVNGEEIFSGDLPCISGDNLIKMANGLDSRTLCDKDGPVGQKGGGNINGPADFVQADIETCNGVVHIIDKVLLYPGL